VTAPDEPDATPSQRPIKPPEDVPAISAEDLVDNEHPGPGMVEERRYPSTIGGALYLLVLAVVAAGMVAVVMGYWRGGVRTMGGALIFAATVRLALRPIDAGMLAVRHKVLDAVVLVVMGALLIFLATSIPDQPGF
jgi:hypothetical protein